MLLLFCHVLFAAPNLLPAIEESRNVPVNLNEAYGEGEGSFDSRSRFTVKSFDCMTWLQWVLAESYAATSPLTTNQYLDAIRYYENTVGFNFRKHFIDRWLIYEPAPLVPTKITECSTSDALSVQLDLQKFREQKKYSCSLYQENDVVEHLVIPYLSVEKMNGCTSALPDGFYVLFMVPNDLWIERWSRIGEMGTVHSMILHQTQEGSTVYQASVDNEMVSKESWDQVKNRLQPVAKGYRVFSLDSNWVPQTTKKSNQRECR